MTHETVSESRYEMFIRTWQAVINHPQLSELPFKLELNEKGHVEFTMSPASNWHSMVQGRVLDFLERVLPNGVHLPECSILTAQGVKVADVVWCSTAFFQQHRNETPYSQAPELCVEVLSPSNTEAEINDKIALYLAAGAHEVWIVSYTGAVTVYQSQEPVAQSSLVGGSIQLDLP